MADQEASPAHHLADLTDPRIDRSRPHERLDIVAIALGAVVAGAGSRGDIEDLGDARHGWLKGLPGRPDGLPSHDTSRRLLERLDPGESQRGPLSRIGAPHGATGRQVIAGDGETPRRSFDRAGGKSALHPVHAWATASHPLLGQVAVDQKSNEITAIPVLLKALEITGAIVTTDAMGCREEIARTIRGRQADSILASRADRERRLGQVVASRDGACARLMTGPDIRSHREWSGGHGRDEARRCWATSDLGRREGRGGRKDLKSVAMAEAGRSLGEAPSVETGYDPSGLESDAELLDGAIRSDWGVGDSLHRALDVTSDEGRSRIKEEDAPGDFGLLRRPASCRLKKESPTRRGIKGKRLRASWDEGDLQRVLCGNAGN